MSAAPTVRDLSWGAKEDEDGDQGRLEQPHLASRRAIPAPLDPRPQIRRTGFEEIAGKPMESLPLTEKEGFEPSFDAKAQPERVGFEHAGSVPSETLDVALAEKVKAILARDSETVA